MLHGQRPGHVGRHLSGTGPEDYNDTSDDPNGTATVTGSGSSSALTHQTFGDVLGVGGDIASGSLSYTVSSSDTDAATTIESGTETIADELSDGPSQTASYTRQHDDARQRHGLRDRDRDPGRRRDDQQRQRLVHLVRWQTR